MGYNYNFALTSILFMSLTMVFYLRQNRMRDTQDHIYTVMLFGGLTAVLFDFIAAAIEPLGTQLPVWLSYLCNMLFILGEQLCLPAFMVFSLLAAGKYNRMRKTVRRLIMIPFLIVALLTLIAPLCTLGIFYIGAENVYCQGATHWCLYAATGLYMSGSYLVLLLNYRAVDRPKRRSILFFGAVLLLALVLQVLYPRYLLATSATALALTAMYYVLRAPGVQADPSTGALHR